MPKSYFNKLFYSNPFRKTPKDLRLTALMIIRNEAIYLEKSLNYLINSGLSVAIIDNQSTDNSLEIIKSFVDEGMPVNLFHHPFSGNYDWEDLLRKAEEIAHQIETDWFILTAPDEIMEPPLPFNDLLEGIRFVDRKGYNVINFDEFVFIPSAYDENYIGRNFEKEMKCYYFHEPKPFRLGRAWKPNGRGFNLSKSGSHKVLFDNQKVYPENFILKHYIFLSYEHGVQKYASRIFPREAINKGWHYNRYNLSSSTIKLPLKGEMKVLAEKQNFDKSDPKKKHLFIREPEDLTERESRLNLRDIQKIPPPDPLKWDKKQNVCFFLTYDLKSIEPILPFLLSITGTEPISHSDSLSNYVKIILKEIEKNYGFSPEKHEFPREYCQDVGENDRVQYVIDISSENHSLMPAIQKLIPVSKFVHIIQDINHMDLSNRHRDPEEIKKYCMGWAEYIKETRQNSQYCHEFLEIKIEELNSDPMKFYQKLVSFLGVELDEYLTPSINEQDWKMEKAKEGDYPNGIENLVQYWRNELGYDSKI